MALDLTKYQWFKYDENGAELVYDQPRHSEDYELDIHPGNVYGIRKYANAYFLVHKNSPKIQFRLNATEITRLTDNSSGWTGKILKQVCKPGVGGKDKEPEGLPDGWLQIGDMNSSNIRTAIYNKKAKILYIAFHNGASWAYENVSLKEYKEMEAFESRGKYFYWRIRNVKTQYQIGNNFEKPPYDTKPQGAHVVPPKAAEKVAPSNEPVSTGDIRIKVSGHETPPPKTRKPRTPKK